MRVTAVPVLVWSVESGDLRFSVINTCIYPLAYLDGAWLISVETLSLS